jgi:hypothetical protein
MRLALLAAVLSLAAAGCSKSRPAPGATAAPAAAAAKPAAKAEIPSLTVDEVDHELAAKQITAVDCNDNLLRKKTGVIPGAILLADIESYDASVLPADKGAKLVFYCHDPG